MTEHATVAPFVQQLLDAIALGIGPAVGGAIELALRDTSGDVGSVEHDWVDVVIATGGSEPFFLEVESALAEQLASGREIVEPGTEEDPDARTAASFRAVAEVIASQLEEPLRLRWPAVSPRLESVRGGRFGPARARSPGGEGATRFEAVCKIGGEPSGVLAIVLSPALLLRLGFTPVRAEGSSGVGRAAIVHVVRLAALGDDGGDLSLLADASRFETRVVESVDELADVVRASPTDLIVVEGDRPGEPVAAILQRCRASSGRRTVPAVVLTGRPTRSAVITAFRAGARGFVVKPFDRGELEQALREALEPGVRGHRGLPFPAV